MAQDGTQGPTGWNDDERVRRWIVGARQREGQMAPISAELFAAARAQWERRFVEVALARAGGSRTRTARELGLSRQGLLKLMARLGMH